MKRLIAAVIALAASTALASAGQAVWSETSIWTVEGNTSGWCMAKTEYVTGHGISIGLNSLGWTLFVSGVNSIPGDTYSVAMMATNGASGTLIGRGLGGNTVVFDKLTPRTIANLAQARGLTIQGLGSFRLDGSHKAIRDTMECFAAMSGQLS